MDDIKQGNTEGANETNKIDVEWFPFHDYVPSYILLQGNRAVHCEIFSQLATLYKPITH